MIFLSGTVSVLAKILGLNFMKNKTIEVFYACQIEFFLSLFSFAGAKKNKNSKKMKPLLI